MRQVWSLHKKVVLSRTVGAEIAPICSINTCGLPTFQIQKDYHSSKELHLRVASVTMILNRLIWGQALLQLQGILAKLSSVNQTGPATHKYQFATLAWRAKEEWLSTNSLNKRITWQVVWVLSLAVGSARILAPRASQVADRRSTATPCECTRHISDRQLLAWPPSIVRVKRVEKQVPVSTTEMKFTRATAPITSHTRRIASHLKSPPRPRTRAWKIHVSSNSLLMLRPRHPLLTWSSIASWWTTLKAVVYIRSSIRAVFQGVKRASLAARSSSTPRSTIHTLVGFPSRRAIGQRWPRARKGKCSALR